MKDLFTFNPGTPDVMPIVFLYGTIFICLLALGVFIRWCIDPEISVSGMAMILGIVQGVITLGQGSQSIGNYKYQQHGPAQADQIKLEVKKDVS
jgi:hypothetical protein